MTDADAPILDPVALQRLERLGGHALRRRMVQLFLETAPERLEAAAVGAAGGDLDGVERAAHSLRSSAGNIGAAAVAYLTGALETAAARGDAPEVQSLLGSLRDALEATCRALAAARGEDAT
jgi:HPt (histidine-containing phosphotransfer) domain-containing protein